MELIFSYYYNIYYYVMVFCSLQEKYILQMATKRIETIMIIIIIINCGEMTLLVKRIYWHFSIISIHPLHDPIQVYLMTQ